MAMRSMSGLVMVNNTDIWGSYGAFLYEEKPGKRLNLDALFSAAKMKDHVAVDIREQNGEKYSSQLTQNKCARDVTLHFAIYAPSSSDFVTRYSGFLAFLRTGSNGWLTFNFPTLGLTLNKMYVKEMPGGFSSISDLWHPGEQCGAFKVTFREPVSSF